MRQRASYTAREARLVVCSTHMVLVAGGQEGVAEDAETSDAHSKYAAGRHMHRA